MTIGPLRIRLLWVLLALALLGMVGGLFALQDVARRIDAAERRTPEPDTRRLPTTRFSSAFSPGPRMGDLRDLLEGVERRGEEGEPSPTPPEETMTPEPEPERDRAPRPSRDEPRTPRQPRTPQGVR